MTLLMSLNLVTSLARRTIRVVVMARRSLRGCLMKWRLAVRADKVLQHEEGCPLHFVRGGGRIQLAFHHRLFRLAYLLLLVGLLGIAGLGLRGTERASRCTRHAQLEMLPYDLLALLSSLVRERRGLCRELNIPACSLYIALCILPAIAQYPSCECGAEDHLWQRRLSRRNGVQSSHLQMSRALIGNLTEGQGALGSWYRALYRRRDLFQSWVEI